MKSLLRQDMVYHLDLLILNYSCYFLLMTTLLASAVIGLQNQLNVLCVAAERLCLTVNLDKSKVIVFRKGGFLAAKEKWFLGGAVVEVVNNYKYLGLTFSTGHSFTAAMEDTSV